MRFDALVISVGGKPAPVKTSIETVQPEVLRLLASAQSRADAEALGAASGAEWAVLEVDPDDLGAVYRAARGAIAEVLGSDVRARIAVDYTGGTKTMSSGLAMAGLDAGVELFVTSGVRRDATFVESGEATVLVHAEDVSGRRQLESSVVPLVDAGAYGGAAHLVRQIARDQPTAHRGWWLDLLALLEALDHWDRFDHAAALDRWPASAKAWAHRSGLLVTLERLVAHAAGAPRRDLVGDEPVTDLVLNAERRAAERRYDDAVGRLYRATEMVAQLRLLRVHAVAPDQVDGLTGAYEALVERRDPAGELWERDRSKVLDVLATRNSSLLAHGTTPVDSASWERVRRALVPFIGEVAATFGERHEPVPLPRGSDLLAILPPPW